MAMDLAIEEYDKGVLILVDGDIDTLTASQLQSCLTSQLTDTSQVFIIDMAKVRYISSMGLRVFLSHLKRVKARGGYMVISGAGQLVIDVFRMSGFLEYFEMTTDLDSARSRLA